MKFKSILAAAAATGLAVSSVAAQAGAQPLPAREGSEIADTEQLRGGWVIPLLAVLAIIAGILAATGGDDEDLPTSP